MRMNNHNELYWEDVREGEELPSVEFPLSVYRLVMAASGNQDFNSIHHNSEYAKTTGAPEMYANNFFLQGMWERTVREYIGKAGVIKSLRGFRMVSFNTVGETVVVTGKVKRKWKEDNEHLIEIQLQSETSVGVTVGPGSIVAALPTQS